MIPTRRLRPVLSFIPVLMLTTIGLADAPRYHFTPLPLGPAANRLLTDTTPEADGQGGWSDQGPDNSLTGFPTGRTEFQGIPFELPAQGPVALMFQGKAVGKTVKNLPATATIQAPGQGAVGSTLYVLATLVWGGQPDAVVGRLTVEHTDGKTQKLALRLGRECDGWWEPKELPKAVIAWTGKNGRGARVGAYLIPLTLSESKAPVRSIKIDATTDDDFSLVILGLTLGDKPAAEVLPKKPAYAPWADNDSTGWWPLTTQYDKADKPAVWEDSFAFLNHPAGELGWTQAQGENFVFAGKPEQPVRFKGVVGCGSFFYPPLSQAPRYASVLAKFGFNQVRFHSIFDVLLKEKEGYKIPVYNEDRLERFDKIFAELKKRGIYTEVSMLFSTRWHPSTGIAAADKIQSLNNTQYFYDPKHQAVYLEALAKFLEHRNPFTGLRYADDPALHMIKVVNEASLFFYTTDSSPGPYRLMLQDRWNQWLRDKYQTQMRLAESWTTPHAGNPLKSEERLAEGTIALLNIYELANASATTSRRAADQTRFYFELEKAWFQRVQKTVRDAGSQALLQGSSWGGPRHLQEIQTAVNAPFDFIGKHTYYDHPSGGWNADAAEFFNDPVTLHPEKHPLLCLYQHVAGKPMMITEWAFARPNDYTNEGAPFFAAYGALQNLAGWQQFVVEVPEYSSTLESSFFNIFSQPGNMAVQPLAYFMFVRGDVRAAPLIYQQNLTDEQLHNPQRKDGIAARDSGSRFHMAFEAQSVPSDAMLIGGVRLGLNTNSPTLWNQQAFTTHDDPKTGTLTSVTGELLWNTAAGFIHVRTPKTHAVMGFFGDRTYAHGPVRMSLHRAYGVAGVSSLDNQPLDQSQRILITLTGRQRNTDQSYLELQVGGKRVPGKPAFRVGNLGQGPILMEPATLDLTLRTTQTGSWRLTPVDLNGYALDSAARMLQTDADGLRVTIHNADAHALNYLLEHRP